ncbi:MAG: PIG-L deacetylase family protein [Alphaproteobacteria bacterium]
MAETVLIVAAHPDDEILGCGGTVARHVADGDTVHSLILAEGATARAATADETPPDMMANMMADLRAAGAKAAAALGARPPRFLGFADNRLDTMALLDIVKAVETVLDEVRPAIVYTHHAGDLNVDHRVCHQAVLTACRPLPGADIRAIYAFETPSSTEWGGPGTGPAFQPVRFVDIATHLEAKLAALACYDMEMRPFPHPRSADAAHALAIWRGANAGLGAGEAFEVVREIDRGANG